MDNLFWNKHEHQPSSPPVPWTPRDVAWGLGVFVLWIVYLGLITALAEKLSLPLDTGLIVVFGASSGTSKLEI